MYIITITHSIITTKEVLATVLKRLKQPTWTCHVADFGEHVYYIADDIAGDDVLIMVIIT